MVRNIRECTGFLLPTTATSPELVLGIVPVIHAGAMGLQIWGAFVGQSAGKAMWDEMDPRDPAARSKAFEMNRLLVVDGGPGWLHPDFTNGWIRVVADTWEPWLIILPGIWWAGDI